VIDKVYVHIQGFRNVVALNSDSKLLQIYFIKKLGEMRTRHKTCCCQFDFLGHASCSSLTLMFELKDV
jgi:hypothetical protein